jgi:putative ABC transport system permease protein
VSFVKMALLEMLRNRLTSVLLLCAVCVGAALAPVADVLLRLYAAQTRRVLERKQDEVRVRMDEMWDEYRRATLGLGFNILILPEGQNLADYYAEGRITRDMPEEYSQRLAQSDIVVVQHVLPALHHRTTWQPYGVSINVIGVRGELPPMGGKAPKKPLREAVPKGTVVLGSELCRIANVTAGETVRILGKSFTVDSCHAPRGDQDDMSAWVDLDVLQAMLGKDGRINAILALECRCEADSTLPNIAKIRAELEKVLPGTRVIEFMSQALTRAEARHKAVLTAREALAAERALRTDMAARYNRMAGLLVPLCGVVCMAAVALVTWVNCRNRRREIAVLRTIGWTAGRVLRLFVAKAALIGVIGALSGGALSAAVLTGARSFGDVALEFDAVLWVLSLAGAVVLSVVAAWLPALAASLSDPALILQKE